MTLTTTELEALRDELKSEREAVVEELGSYGKVVDDAGTVEAAAGEGEEADLLDVADNIEALTTNIPIVAELTKRVRDIDAALQKMKDHTYGTCDECGEEIDTARLEANPAATTCITHA